MPSVDELEGNRAEKWIGDGDRVRLHDWALDSMLASLMLTLFLAALDQTIVNTALPKILRDINGFDRCTWLIIAYLLTATHSV